MKNLILFLLVPFFGLAQFTEVVDAPALKKSNLYSNGLTWVTKTFNSANDVIQMQDTESGKIILKCFLSSAPKTMGVKANGNTYATITILCKDEKYKYEVNDIGFKYQQGQIMTYDKPTKAWKEEVDKEINGLIESLKTEMQKTDEF